MHTVHAHLLHAAQPTLLQVIRTLRHTSMRSCCERVSAERVGATLRPSAPRAHQHLPPISTMPCTGSLTTLGTAIVCFSSRSRETDIHTLRQTDRRVQTDPHRHTEKQRPAVQYIKEDGETIRDRGLEENAAKGIFFIW